MEIKRDVAPRASSTPHRGLLSWALYDSAESAFAAIITTFVFAAYFTRQVAENEAIGSAQWGSMLSIVGVTIAFGGPLLGAIADQGGRRKPWIAGFTGLCIVSTACLWFIKPMPTYAELALLLVGLATLGSEFAFMFYNAMLPGLAKPEYLGRWSGWGWSIGYLGGITCLAIALLVFIQPDSRWAFASEPAQPVRATFLLAAAWYFLFSLPLFLFTPDTPGTGKPPIKVIKEGIRQLYTTLRQARRYNFIGRFLIARMIYTDGLATLFAFGGVYAAGTFNLTEQEIVLFGIGLHITAGLGAAGFAWLDDWFGSKQTILLSLIGLMGSGTFILLVKPLVLFWIFGLLLGIFVGPVQAASRTYLARVAPEPLRNEMFGLYVFSGKAISFLGPFLVGWGTYLSGNQRVGMSTIIIFFLLGFLLMLTVPKATSKGSLSKKIR